jgi:hypothetical protein
MVISHTSHSHALTNVLAAVFLAGGLMAGIGTASSQESQPWKVTGKILGESRKTGDPKKSEDVSGVACAMTDLPRVCIIVDDETQGAQVVILKNGELVAGDFIRLISTVFEDAPLELDAEGVTYADGVYYVIGSHGRPRHADGNKEVRNVARAEATRHVFRIALSSDAVDKETGRVTVAPDVRNSTRLGEFIKAQPDLKGWFDEALEDNGLTVEGLAAHDGKLYVGMRGPVLAGGNAVILEVPIAAVFNGLPAEGILYKLNLGKDTSGNLRGIRDLVPYMGSFLVLAGPVNDPPDGYRIRKGDYTVMSWNGTGITGRFDLEGYGEKVKPETLLPLEEKVGKFRALILFDGPDEGRPTPVTVDLRQDG